jgi:hypothetical protein
MCFNSMQGDVLSFEDRVRLAVASETAEKGYVEDTTNRCQYSKLGAKFQEEAIAAGWNNIAVATHVNSINEASKKGKLAELNAYNKCLAMLK